MALRKVLGVDTLKCKSTSGKSPVGDDVAVSTLEGKTLLLYFSASWCGPCRQFTPLLSKFYREQKEKVKKEIKEAEESGSPKKVKDFEIVWVSADRSKDEFEGYYKDQPWLTLPWGDEKEKKHREKLSKKFKIQSIPTLIVIDKDGKTVTSKGKDYMLKDTEGKKFPWIPRKIYEVLGECKLTTYEGKTLTVENLKKTDAFALYFSAHWCPPCRSFTPRLVSTYTKLKRAGKNTEFIFVSSDREESAYKEYLEEMPWASVGFADARIPELKEVCEVGSIPSLVTCKGEDGTIINKEARTLAADDPEGKEFPWKKNALLTCNPFVPSDSVVEAVNNEICVILSANDATNKETFKIEFTAAAEKYQAQVLATENGGKSSAPVAGGDAAPSSATATTPAAAEGTTTAAPATTSPTPANDNDDAPVRFFICDSPEGNDLYTRVLAAIGAGQGQAGVATVMSINLGNDRAKARMPGEISTQNILDHVAHFKKQQEIKEDE